MQNLWEGKAKNLKLTLCFLMTSLLRKKVIMLLILLVILSALSGCGFLRERQEKKDAKSSICLTEGLLFYSEVDTPETQDRLLKHNVKWCKKCRYLEPDCKEYFKEFPE